MTLSAVGQLCDISQGFQTYQSFGLGQPVPLHQALEEGSKASLASKAG